MERGHKAPVLLQNNQITKAMTLSRPASTEEQRLLKFLIAKSLIPIKPILIESLLVESMNDGGMGSLRLFPNGVMKEERLFGKCASEHRFIDKDGVEVIASINVDKNGELFELDIWKTDFNPLVSIPEEF